MGGWVGGWVGERRRTAIEKEDRAGVDELHPRRDKASHAVAALVGAFDEDEFVAHVLAQALLVLGTEGFPLHPEFL